MAGGVYAGILAQPQNAQGTGILHDQTRPGILEMLSRVPGALVDGAMAPARWTQGVMNGSQGFYDANGNVTPEAAGQSLMAALAATTGAAPMPRPPGAVSMGLDLNLFHGSPNAAIEGALRPSEYGALGPGVYATPADHLAGRYATEGGKVYPMRTDADIFDGMTRKDTEASYSAFKADKQRLVDALPPADKEAVGARILRADGTSGFDVWNELKARYGKEGAQDVLKRAGFKGMAAHVDGPEVVIFDPQHIRRTDSTTDPRTGA